MQSLKNVADVQISEKCMRSYPCKHIVTFTYQDGTIKNELMNGVDIAKMLMSMNRDLGHFSMYQKMIK